MALEEPVIVKDPRAENEVLAYLLGCLLSVQETPGAIPDPTQTWRDGPHFAIQHLGGTSQGHSLLCVQFRGQHSNETLSSNDNK